MNVLVVCGIDRSDSNDMDIVINHLEMINKSGEKYDYRAFQYHFLCHIDQTDTYGYFKEKYDLRNDIIIYRGVFGYCELPPIIFDMCFFNFCYEFSYTVKGLGQMIQQVKPTGYIFVTGFETFKGDFDEDTKSIIQMYYQIVKTPISTMFERLDMTHKSPNVRLFKLIRTK